MSTFFTIGHSTRTLLQFINLLVESHVALVVDIRSVPRSRTNPQFNADSLPASLALSGIGYHHIAALGGFRGRRHGVSPSANPFWKNASFRNYADYAATEEFRRGFEVLRQLGSEQCCAVMCAEAVWWRCHRRIVADYLIAAGESVFHIMGPGKIEPARLTPSAQAMPDGSLIYPSVASS